MEFKRCVRCGCFFMSANDICCNCESKDMLDIAKVNTILEENSNFNSIQELSIASGVNISNLNRLIDNNKISDIGNIIL